MNYSIERVKCSAMTIDGVDVPETNFNEPVVLPCNAGWEGSLNATCSSTGNWEVGNHCGEFILLSFLIQ